MMSTRIKATCATLGVAALLLPAVAGAAGDAKRFSRPDFERCNQQAMQIAGVAGDAPAASPGTSSSGSSSPGTTSGAGTSGSGSTGTMSGPGAGTTSGSGTMSGSGSSAGAGSDQELDRVVQAYRDCLQQQRN